MEPKPLSKKQLAEIARAFSGRPDSPDPRLNYAVETITELLAAEQFWREAVKAVDPYVVHRDQGSDWKSCRFCDGGRGRPQHKPGCPWQFAQEST